MKEHGLDEPYKDSLICPFVVYYQFYRELMFALEHNGYFVMLIDEKNPAFNRPNGRGLVNILRERLSKKHQDLFKVVYIHDVVKILEENNYSLASDFRLKYGM